MGTGGPFPGG